MHNPPFQIEVFTFIRIASVPASTVPQLPFLVADNANDFASVQSAGCLYFFARRAGSRAFPGQAKAVYLADHKAQDERRWRRVTNEPYCEESQVFVLVAKEQGLHAGGNVAGRGGMCVGVGVLQREAGGMCACGRGGAVTALLHPPSPFAAS